MFLSSFSAKVTHQGIGGGGRRSKPLDLHAFWLSFFLAQGYLGTIYFNEHRYLLFPLGNQFA